MVLELLSVLGYFGDALGFDFLLITRVYKAKEAVTA